MKDSKRTTWPDLHGGQKDIVWNRMLDRRETVLPEDEPSDHLNTEKPSEVSCTP